MNSFYLLTFENTHNAMNGEAALKENGIKNIVMPTPTYITKSCGISLRVNEQDLPTIRNLIKDEKIKIKGVFFKDNNEFRSIDL